MSSVASRDHVPARFREKFDSQNDRLWNGKGDPAGLHSPASTPGGPCGRHALSRPAPRPARSNAPQDRATASRACTRRRRAPSSFVRAPQDTELAAISSAGVGMILQPATPRHGLVIKVPPSRTTSMGADQAHIDRGPRQGDCILGVAHYQLSGRSRRAPSWWQQKKRRPTRRFARASFERLKCGLIDRERLR